MLASRCTISKKCRPQTYTSLCGTPLTLPKEVVMNWIKMAVVAVVASAVTLVLKNKPDAPAQAVGWVKDMVKDIRKDSKTIDVEPTSK